MRVLYYGPFRDGSGYAIAARGYLKALDQLVKDGEDLELKLVTLNLEGLNSHLSKEDEALVGKYEIPFDRRTGKLSKDEVDKWLQNKEPYVFMWHQPAPMITWERYHTDDFWTSIQRLLSNATWNITCTVWEGSSIHEAWRDTYEIYDVDAVVVPSKFNKKIFEQGLKNQKVYYIPHPVEEYKGELKEIKLPISLEDKFVIFSMSQWGIRKGFEKLIIAYYMEFGHQQDVLLLVKTNGNIMNSEDQQKQSKLIKEDASSYKKMIHMDAYMEHPSCDILLLSDFMPIENIQWLYKQADVFCLPTRGEGFGLTLAEAIMNDVLTIAPHETGQKEFMAPVVYPIAGMYEPYMTKQEFHCNMDWFEPSINSIRANLRAAYKAWQKNLLDEDIKRQKDYLLSQNYTIDRIKIDLLNMLREIIG